MIIMVVKMMMTTVMMISGWGGVWSTHGAKRES